MKADAQVLARFAPETLSAWDESGNVIYGVNQGLRLALVNAAWSRFARSHGGSEALAEAPLGQSVIEVMTPALRPFFLRLYARAFSGEQCTHEYLCRRPEFEDRYRMTLYPHTDANLVIVSNALRVSLELPKASGRRIDDYLDRGVVKQCAHCMSCQRMNAQSEWDLLPELLGRAPPSVRISHGLCLPCVEYHYPPGP